MDLKRVHDILNNKIKTEVLYDEKPVWIQEIKDDIAKVGFINDFKEKDVYIEDLYESGIFRDVP